MSLQNCLNFENNYCNYDYLDDDDDKKKKKLFLWIAFGRQDDQIAAPVVKEIDKCCPFFKTNLFLILKRRNFTLK